MGMQLALCRGNHWISCEGRVSEVEVALDVHVNSLGGPLCTVQAKFQWAIRDLKTAVQKATGIPTTEQKLLDATADEEAKDEALLGTLFSTNGAANILLVRIPNCIVIDDESHGM